MIKRIIKILFSFLLIYSTAVPIFAIQHEHKFEIIKEPTCICSGKKECKTCGKTVKINKLGHYYQNCSCTRCDSIIDIDERSKTIILTRDVYHGLGLPQSGEVIIPEKVSWKNSEYTVVGIGCSLFYENTEITSVVLPKTIEHIQEYAFNQCENLTHCNLPEGLKSIRMAAFQCCYNLRDIEFPSTLQWIDNFAFNHCNNMTDSSIVLPQNIKRIGDNIAYPAHMFYDCGTENFTEFCLHDNPYGYVVRDGILYARNGKTLVSIPRAKTFENNTYVMPDTVVNLGELSFSRNPNIHTVIISDNLKINGQMNCDEIHSYNNIGNPLSVACYVYSNVSEYHTKSTNPNYISIEGILYTKDKKHVVAVPNKYSGDINIPEGVIAWNKEALWTDAEDHKDIAFLNISSIQLPSSIIDIDEEQIQTINFLVNYYGTQLHINSNNPVYTVGADGLITKK